MALVFMLLVLWTVPVLVITEIPSLKKQMAKKSVSQGEGAYVRDGVCVYAVWKDTKCVSVMSNEHPGNSESTVER